MTRLRSAIEVILIVIIGLLLARAFWLIVDPAGAVSKSAPLPRYATEIGNGISTPVDMGLLTSTNPFDGGREDLVEYVPQAPETALNLRLIGLRAETSDGGGTATIVTPDNDVKVFAPGDDILSGVALDQVLPNQVLLRRNGALESLRFEGRDEGFSVLRGEGEDAPPRKETARVDAQDEETDQGQSGSGDVADSEALLRSIRIEPELENGNVAGYRLTPRGDGALMAAAGLMAGDVLVGIDGDEIVDIAQQDVATRLRDVSSARLRILRNGEVMDVNLTLRR